MMRNWDWGFVTFFLSIICAPHHQKKKLTKSNMKQQNEKSEKNPFHKDKFKLFRFSHVSQNGIDFSWVTMGEGVME